jgi:putative endonuclease
MKPGFVYIITNKYQIVYTGNSNLPQRILDHKEKETKSFAARYNLNMLVYYEQFQWIESDHKRTNNQRFKSSKK